MAPRNRVSILLLPIRASEDVRQRCIRSILNQSHRNLELIIPEDIGTPEHSITDPRIRWLPQTNQLDVAEGFKQALAQSSSTFIALAHPDVVYHKHRIELQLRHFERYPETDVLGTALSIQGKQQYLPGITDAITMRYLLMMSPILRTETLMFRKSISSQGIFDELQSKTPSWNAAIWNMKNRLALGLLSLSTGNLLHPAEPDHLVMALCFRACSDHYGNDFDDLMRGLCDLGDVKTASKLEMIGQQAKALLQRHIDSGKPFPEAFKKALATAVMLQVQRSGLKGLLFRKHLRSWLLPSAVDWQIKLRLALL